MTDIRDKYEKTLPYFLEHGCRPLELVCIEDRRSVKQVIYIDLDGYYINTLNPILWESEVINHQYGLMKVLYSTLDEAHKELMDVPVHYVTVKR